MHRIAQGSTRSNQERIDVGGDANQLDVALDARNLVA
jgi:hypothetical protein